MAKQTFMLLMVNWMKPQRKRKGIGNAHNRTLQTRETLNAHTHTNCQYFLICACVGYCYIV